MIEINFTHKGDHTIFEVNGHVLNIMQANEIYADDMEEIVDILMTCPQDILKNIATDIDAGSNVLINGKKVDAERFKNIFNTCREYIGL